MTTTTPTTRRTRTLASLLGVLALIGAALAFGAPGASADEGKVWICHADVNGTNGPGGPQSDVGDPNGQPDLGQGGSGGEFQIGFNLIEISTSAWENAHLTLHPNDFPAYQKEGAYSCTPFPNVPDTYTVTKTTTATFCWEGAVKTVVTDRTKGITTVDGAVPADARTALDAAAQAESDAAMADLLATTYAARTPVPADGICTTPPPPPVEPEPVAVVEPATVAVPAPATVPVPAKVTLPARIPAGEGPTTPTVPAHLLALLALGTTALAAATVRLVRTTR